MRRLALGGRLLVAAAAVASWSAMLGVWVPSLDALASFLPLFAAAAVVGALIGGRRTRWTLPLAGLGLVPAALATAHESARAIPAAPEQAPRLTLVTHNAWASNDDLAATVRGVVAADADVVVLQEVTPRLAAMLRKGPYRFATPCPGGGCGLMILSRHPILASDYFLRDRRGKPIGPPVLWARIATPGGPAMVATLHYPWPLPAGPQAAKRASLARALTRIDRDALILAGDMNLTPWSAAMRAQDAALAPMTRMTRALFSWPASLPLLPIDHVYAGPGWGLVEARRLPATGSDHRPVLVTLARR